MNVIVDANKVIHCIAARRLSVGQLARKARVAPATARRIVSGEAVNVKSVGKFCAALDVKLADIIKEV